MEKKQAKSYDIHNQLSQKEWQDIEENIILFQKQFKADASQEEMLIAKGASDFLVSKFSPLFRKYIVLLRYGQIDFNDFEMKQFVSLFIDDRDLKKALNRKKQKSEYKAEIYKKFNFILETYGLLNEEDMISDLHTCFLQLCKRYKNVGKNFCAYVYNTYRYEIARHIKSFIKNPINIHYKLLQYEDCINGESDYEAKHYYEDTYHEDSMGLPDYTWINGQGCSDAFCELSTLQRKIIVKYYLEDWNDRQIADYTGLHINTINQKRRQATKHLASKFNIEITELSRCRKSGKKASLPI